MIYFLSDLLVSGYLSFVFIDLEGGSFHLYMQTCLRHSCTKYLSIGCKLLPIGSILDLIG